MIRIEFVKINKPPKMEFNRRGFYRKRLLFLFLFHSCHFGSQEARNPHDGADYPCHQEPKLNAERIRNGPAIISPSGETSMAALMIKANARPCISGAMTACRVAPKEPLMIGNSKPVRRVGDQPHPE